MYMLTINTSLAQAPVMSLQTGGQLGEIQAAIVDPRKLQVVAFYVGGPRIQTKSVLHTTDIREIGPLGVIVNAADDIMDLDQDLVRLQEVINLQFTLIGKPVVDDTRHKLGKVTEYSLDTTTFLIKKLHVSQSIMKNLMSSSLMIDRSQIIEVTDGAITVRSATVPQQSGLAQALNPFRKSRSSLASD